ncbi:MAG: cyclase family protein [Candidatus Aminicenantes bacterium]|nr:cyclase family protein [Candidatus Aminicenantes bacterium]
MTEPCSRDRDYLLTVEDIKNWEKKHGTIPENVWVIMYTGIDTRYYPDKEKVIGTSKTGEAAIPELHFPGFSPESARFLTTERDITGIAIDTPSNDYGQSKEFKVHRILFAADKVALENIARLDQLTESGATLYVMPMMIEEGTGVPAWVFVVF